MNQLNDVELSSSFIGEPLFEINHFCNWHNESIFGKKLSEMKKKRSPSRFPQINEGYDEYNETPNRNSNNVLSKNFFSPRSTKMLKDYTLSEKIRIKWLRSIRDYVRLQEMQVVYNYLKTANVNVIIRNLRLRKCLTLWHLRYQERNFNNKWKAFAAMLLKKQRMEKLTKDASKIMKAKALAKAPTAKEENYREDTEQVFQDKPAEKPISIEHETRSKSPHRKHHRIKQKSESNDENIKSRDINIENEVVNSVETPDEARDKVISNLIREKEALEKRINDCEKREKQQERYIERLSYLFIICAGLIALIVFISGIIIGKSIKSTERKLNTFVNSQTRIAQDLTAEVADFRIALTKMANANKTVVPDS